MIAVRRSPFVHVIGRLDQPGIEPAGRITHGGCQLRFRPGSCREDQAGLRGDGEEDRGRAQRLPGHGPQPRDARGVSGAQRHIAQDQVDGKLRELAYIKTSELNGCDYCLHHHRALGKKAGLNDRQVAETAQGETSDAYDELEREVMRYAEEVTRHINVSDELLGRLKKKLSDREMVELAMTVGIANFTNRVTETLRMELP